MSDWSISAAVETARRDPERVGREWFEACNKRIDASNRANKLERALREAEEVLALMERPAHEDPDLSSAVQAIGGGVSYGAIMSSAEALWRQLLERDGYPSGGEHVHGPSRGTVVKTLATVRQALSK